MPTELEGDRRVAPPVSAQKWFLQAAIGWRLSSYARQHAAQPHERCLPFLSFKLDLGLQGHFNQKGRSLELEKSLQTQEWRSS